MKINSVYDNVRNAAKTAFDRVAKASDMETDPDLLIYEGLKPDDFDVIMESYGVENMLKYIKAMEFRKATGRK